MAEICILSLLGLINFQFVCITMILIAVMLKLFLSFSLVETRPTSISSAGSLTKEPIENDSFSGMSLCIHPSLKFIAQWLVIE